MKKETKSKQITIDDLAVLIKNSHNTLSEKIDQKIDGLAIIVASSFEGMEERLTKDIKGFVKEEVGNIKENLTTKIEGLGKRIDDFAETKASKTSHKELVTRVEFIEKKLEITK